MSTECQSVHGGDRLAVERHRVHQSAQHGGGRDKALMKEGTSMGFVRYVLPLMVAGVVFSAAASV